MKVFNADGRLLHTSPSMVSDIAYDEATWNGVTNVAPSKNAVRDKLEAVVAAHAILDGTVHTDSVADAVTRGSLIYGNATPKWDELVKGAADTVLGSDGTDVMYRTMAQLWASLSGDAAAAVDMNGQFFSDMPIENGATVPASPRTGEMFLHTPTGRNVLMMYDGSNWIPIMSIGSMTVYVDKTDGSDDIDKGTAVDADAFATIQYAVDQMPGLVGGNVIIYINGETYTEHVVVRGKAVTGDYTIKFQGTMVTDEASQAIGAVTQTTLTDTGQFTGDSYTGYLCRCTKGGETDMNIPIRSHTNDVLTFAGQQTGSVDDTYNYEVLHWSTIVEGTAAGGAVGCGFRIYVPNVVIYQIDLTPNHASSGQCVRVEEGGAVLVDSCKAVQGPQYGVWLATKGTYVNIKGCYFETPADGKGFMIYSRGWADLGQGWFKGPAKGTGAGYALVFAATGGTIAQAGCLIEDCVTGFWASGASVLQFASGVNSRCYVEDCTTGIKADLNGIGLKATVQNFNNNTTDTATATGGQVS